MSASHKSVATLASVSKATKDQYIVHGPDLLENIPEVSYGKVLFHCLKLHYDLPTALIDVITRKSLSYKTVFEQSLRLAHSLRRYGITQKDVIGISSENNLSFCLPLIAGFFIGATVTLFNPQYTLREILHVANISKPNIIFCSKTSIQETLKVQKDLEFLTKIITFDDCNDEGSVESMESFVAKRSRDYRSFEPVDVDPQKVALILYSSGTTGFPKGVMLTHYNLNSIFTIFRDSRFVIKRPPGISKILGMLPFYHSYGYTQLLAVLLYGDIMLVMPKFEKRLYLKTIQDFKLPSLSIVPSLAHFLATSKLLDDYDLSHVEGISSGGAPLSKHIQELLCKKFKKVTQVRQAYGLTEATIAVTVSPVGYVKPGCVGILLPGTSAIVRDINTGEALGPDCSGELYFKGPQIMKGYAGDIESTNNTIDKDGWLRTGDIGYYDKDGYFYIIDRLKELIKCKGFQVPPAELEAMLLQHPQIMDAAVIGVPDEVAEEVPLAFVVKHPDHNLTEDDVKSFVAKQAIHYKHLRGGVKFIPEIPKSPTGKILRRELRQLLVQKSKL